MAHRRALRPVPVAVGWLLTVGVDLFFNAGAFSALFDQAREPSLLSDSSLFRRIPIAYLGLAVGVAALAWLFDEIDATGPMRGGTVGGAAGLVFAFLGVVGLWTAVDMTGLFVAGAVVVQVAEFATAGAFLGAHRQAPSARLTRGAILVAFGLAVAGIVLQNILPS